MANHTADPGPADPGAAASWLNLDALSPVLWNLLLFTVIVVVGYAIGRGGRAVYGRAIRTAPTSGQLLMGKLMVLASVTVALFMALRLVYNLEPLSLLATLGVVSLALGFGLQNTVANLAAGVGLTLDKPFEVGDRIRIGETWGDVVTIGLRSTRIVTVNGDLVVVPNSLLDTRELWNYTYQEHPKFRLDIPIGISYTSSIPLAESLMLEVARSDDRVLSYPEPHVRAKELADNGVMLELRVWISRAQLRPAVRDRMIRGIKERFDAQGVHFPYPQRTISYEKDIPKAAETPEFLKGNASEKPVVLVCTRSRQSAQAMAPGVTAFVEKLGARMVVLHARPVTQTMNPYEAQAALNVYLDRANKIGIPARAISEIGDLPTVLRRVVRETGAKLVIFGRPQTRWHGVGWVRSEVGGAQAASPVPVVIVDTDGEVPEEVLQRWREHLFPPDADDDGAGTPDEPSNKQPE